MGGIGNIRGAVLGGLIIGIIQQMFDNREASGSSRSARRGRRSTSSRYLVLIMVFKPSGLLGEETREAG